MRRHIVFSFIFVFWSLAVCTVLSAKIEEQMTAQVAKVEAEDKLLPMDVLFEEEDGVHLYIVVKSEGLEKGRRVAEIDEGEFWLNEDCVGIIDDFATYIRYASKEIAPGDLVETTPLYRGKAAEYLVIENGKARMLSVQGELKPFMKEAVKIDLGLSEDSAIYHMSDVKSFAKNFPMIGVILAALATSITLGIRSWKKAKEAKKHARSLVMNIGACGVLFLVFTKLVQKIEVPDSLLPKWNIFEFGYYKDELSEVFHFLKEANETMYKELIWIYSKNMIIFTGIILTTIVLMLASRSNAKG